MKTFLPCLLTLLIILPGCAEEHGQLGAPEGPPLTVWSEFLSYDEVVAEMDFLESYHLRLNLSVDRMSHTFEEMGAVVREANRRGIEVRLWPELTFDEGRWANVKNADVFAAYFGDLMAFVKAERLPVKTLIVDMETSWTKIQRVAELLQAGDFLQLYNYLKDDYDTAAFERGTRIYRDLVREAHAQGFKVYLTVPGLVAEDLTDDDYDIHKLFDITVDGIEWDTISYQIYRSLMWNLLEEIIGGGEMWSNYLVFKYGEILKQKFGDKAALDLGIVGGGEFEGYEEARQLREDMNAAFAAGYAKEQVALFALDGMAGRPDQPAWVTAPQGPYAEPPLDDKVLRYRQVMQLLDIAVVLD